MLNKIQTTRGNKMRICDSLNLNGVTVPIIQGQVSEVEVMSQNGYYYKRDFWRNILGQPCIQDSILSHDMLGMIEHPTDDEDYLKTPYDKASHFVHKAWVESDGNPYAQFGLLNNEQGNNIKALIEIGHKVGVSSRGLGEMANDEKGQYVTDNNYMFLTWDIVRNPNFADLRLDKVTDSLRSNPIFKELVQMNQLKDSADEHYQQSSLLKNMDTAINALISIKRELEYKL